MNNTAYSVTTKMKVSYCKFLLLRKESLIVFIQIFLSQYLFKFLTYFLFKDPKRFKPLKNMEGNISISGVVLSASLE